MLLMAKFGKFKLRIMAAIHMSALLAIFNVASTSSNYWLKYIDPESKETHFAGLWKSCPNNGPCIWKDGIVGLQHTAWSYCIRIFIGIGTIGNILAVLIFLLAFIYKLNKKTRWVVRFLEFGNMFLISSFILIMIGFCMIISNSCNYSIWLHCISMVLIFFASNLLTRHFALFYFINCRAGVCDAVDEMVCRTAKADDDAAVVDEEKIALAPLQKDAVTSTDVTSIKVEVSKATEMSASNEALITQPIATMEIITKTDATTIESA